MPPEPYPSALDAELVLCDVPIIVGLTAMGELQRVVAALPTLRYVLPARAEMSQLWVDGIDGAAEACDIGDLDVDPTDSPDPAVRAALFDQIGSLANAWLGERLDAVEARSAAASFAVARHRSVPLLTHRYPLWTAGMPRNGPRRVLCAGGVELALWLARAEQSASDAWRFYRELAGTIAGEQPGWPVNESQADLRYWADEAAGGRL